MPQSITPQQLKQYKDAIRNGGVNAVGQVYSDLYRGPLKTPDSV
jgi:RNA polymerase-interacting CarD/CdnL/TRCF family regulator